MTRTVLETLSTILVLSIKGVEKTELMHDINLSQQQLEKFLEVLTCKMLLLEDGSFYKTTCKGLNFIEEFDKIKLLWALPSKCVLS